MDQTVSDRNDPGAPQAGRSPHDADLHAWAMRQSAALRDCRVSDLDLADLADEVGGIARHERRRLDERLERLCHQLILWDYGQGHRTRTRARIIARQRLRVGRMLARCPSLDGHAAQALDDGYASGRFGALREDEHLSEASLPDRNPYAWSEAMTRPVGDIAADRMMPSSRPRPADEHDDDVHAWASRQEKALAEGRCDDLDLPHLADEIAALGDSEFRAFESALMRLLQHLLKWDHQPERRSRSWFLTIRGQRGDVLRVLRDNPSLRARREEALREAYRRGRNAMMLETRISDRRVPDGNPYSWDEIMTRPVSWPEP